MAWRNESIGPPEAAFSWTRRLVSPAEVEAGITTAVGLAAIGAALATGDAVGVELAAGELAAGELAAGELAESPGVPAGPFVP